MNKLYLSKDDYKYMSKDARQVTPSSIAVDAYLTGIFYSEGAVNLGDMWERLVNFDRRWEEEYFEELGQELTEIWELAFGATPLPALGSMQGHWESPEWDFDDNKINAVLKKLRLYVIDSIYDVEPDQHD